MTKPKPAAEHDSQEPKLVRMDGGIYEEVEPGVFLHRRDLELAEGGDCEI